MPPVDERRCQCYTPLDRYLDGRPARIACRLRRVFATAFPTADRVRDVGAGRGREVATLMSEIHQLSGTDSRERFREFAVVRLPRVPIEDARGPSAIGCRRRQTQRTPRRFSLLCRPRIVDDLTHCAAPATRSTTSCLTQIELPRARRTPSEGATVRSRINPLADLNTRPSSHA
jgi:hypothetical protein